MSDCLSQRDMTAFVEEHASAEELGLWKRHLRVCDRCAEAVVRLRSGVQAGPEREADTPVRADADTADSLPTGLEPNLQIGDFRLEKRLGAGGMGVVYQAMQISLNRRVAMKVLPVGLAARASTVERFHREARAAAKLHHPNIVTIYAEGAEQNVCYFAMEMIDGQNVDGLIEEFRRARAARNEAADSAAMVNEASDAAVEADAAIPCILRDCKSEAEYLNNVARLICEVAEALDYAHGQGVIHRDVKPSNLILSRDGRLILLDFGIARVRDERAMTLTGSFLGTPRYMSPEQIAGRGKPDHRCDVYSLGVTLYELLTLEPLFDGDTQQQVIGQILGRGARRPRQVNRHIPLDLDTICCKAIDKDPNSRYQTAGELAEDLRRYLGGRVIRAKRCGPTDRLVKLVGRHKTVVALICLLAIASATAATIGWRHYTTRWAQQHGVAEIDALMEQDKYLAAFRLAERLRRYIPDDPLLAERWPRLSRRCSVTTLPRRAKIFIRDYFDDSTGWRYLGRSPLDHIRVPFGTCRWKVQRSGYVTQETVLSLELPSQYVDPAGLPRAYLTFTLQEKGGFPAEMVYIPASDLTQKGMFHGERTVLSAPAYLIDKHETTNRQFREFINKGGYENREFWREPFVKDGESLPWSQAMSLFHDRTGRPGPATWSNGTYPQGRADCPVGGICWYEAMAYARFRGKDLPSLFHWAWAARAEDVPSRITQRSNFGEGSAPVGSHRGMGRFGLCDAAGNVREWCLNAFEGRPEVRCILGGAWSEHRYVFACGAARSLWDRDAGNGLRCARYPEGRDSVPQAAFAPVEHKDRDLANFKPVSDDVFQSYIDAWYHYDRTELNASVESVDYELDYCRRERITFDATYPNERVIAYLHLPNGVKRPYQVVVWYPGGGARSEPWGPEAYCHELVHIIQSGRALVVPFYQGTYERCLEKDFYPPDGVLSRNLCVQRSQDMRRTIDYLETRGDVDCGKLAYVGLGWGAQMGPVMIATEDRFKTGVLLLGGICACKRHPASDPANFASRVTIPMLMLNGREDSLFPYEAAQKPLFNLLGTPQEHKKHILFPGEHCIPWENREQYHKAIADWLDKYLGRTGRIDD